MGECRKKIYETNKIILRGPVSCWGFVATDNLQCEHLKKCLEENKDDLESTVYDRVIKKIK